METTAGIYTPTAAGAVHARERIPDSAIVSEDLQNELITWRDCFTTGYFRIGDVALGIIEESHQKALPVTKMRIYSCIGRFCGKSGRSVRYYASVAKFFPKNTHIRDEMGILLPPYDTLPFRTFLVASSHEDQWEGILNHALDHPNLDEEGLRRWIGRSVAAGVLETVAAGISSVPNPDDLDEIEDGGIYPSPVLARPFDTGLHMLSDLIERVEKTVLTMQIADSTKEEVFDCLAKLRNLLPQIFIEPPN